MIFDFQKTVSIRVLPLAPASADGSKGRDLRCFLKSKNQGTVSPAGGGRGGFNELMNK
jgi:hypothetical protein